MQTLKTAIVVVLLLTVTYSAYVALTAPTPELPAEVASLVEGGNFDLGDIGMGEIDAGSPADFAVDPAATPPSIPRFPETPNTPAPNTPAPGVATPGVAASDYALGDATGSTGTASPAAENSPASARISDQGPPSPSNVAAANGAAANGAAGGSPHSLPKPDPSTGPVSGDPAQAYPSTAFADFDISAASGTLDPSDAKPEDGADATASVATDASTAPLPGLVNAIATADRQWENDELREALTTLSLFYNDPALQPADREALQARLDMLAGEVIYSTRHLLEQPYRVRQGDTLETIAATYEVPWQLLANINQVDDPAAIVPGQELKIMRGPFRAEVNLQRAELTLFLGELYAGRFPITVGTDPAPEPGTYTIEDKQTDRTYYPLSGANIPAGDPRNPYGNFWMDLGGQLCIHGSPQTPTDTATGCIQLRTADAGDVFGILSKGSAVSIMR